MSRNEDPSDAEPKRHAKDNLSSRARSSPASTRSSSSSCAGMMKACGLSSGSPDCMEYSLSGSPTTIQRCRRFRAQSDTRTLYADRIKTPRRRLVKLVSTLARHPVCAATLIHAPDLGPVSVLRCRVPVGNKPSTGSHASGRIGDMKEEENTASERIPRTMVTQHPDSASRYTAIQEEAKEAVHALSPPPMGFGIEEVMVDFEGKMTPYHQTNAIAQGLMEGGVVPGRDVWITPRISSATEEGAFRQLMALMSVIEATYKVSQQHPEAHIEEVIVPMVRSARDLVKVRDRIRDVIYLGHKEFRLPYDPDSLQLVPLVEEAPELLSCGRLLTDYVGRCAEEGFGVRRLRVMVGRSDAALSYGHIASALSAKVGMAQICLAAQNLGLEPAPIYGAGYLPFRGGVMLENIEGLIRDFPAIRTVTGQSGIRYDTEEAPQAVEKLHRLGSLL